MRPRSANICIDRRENRPLPIPKIVRGYFAPDRMYEPEDVIVTWVRKTIRTGDYGLIPTADFYFAANTAVVETKRSLSELYGNCVTSRGQFERFLTRLTSEFTRPLLIVEGGLTTLYDTVRGVDTSATVDRFQQLLMQHRVPFLFTTPGPAARRMLADFVVRWLLNGALTPGVLPCPDTPAQTTLSTPCSTRNLTPTKRKNLTRMMASV